MKKTMLILSLVVSVLAFAAGCSSYQRTSEPASQSADLFPLIDMHMHTYQWNKYGEPPQPNLITGSVPVARTNGTPSGLISPKWIAITSYWQLAQVSWEWWLPCTLRRQIVSSAV